MHYNTQCSKASNGGGIASGIALQGWLSKFRILFGLSQLFFVLAKKCDFSRVSVWAGRVEFLFATLRLIEYWSGYYTTGYTMRRSSNGKECTL